MKTQILSLLQADFTLNAIVSTFYQSASPALVQAVCSYVESQIPSPKLAPTHHKLLTVRTVGFNPLPCYHYSPPKKSVHGKMAAQAGRRQARTPKDIFYK
jgi:hypothetical protein